ncbi:MAG: hypothetical protein Q9227_000907 [Pyrenula ochraceoflavens]
MAAAAAAAPMHPPSLTAAPPYRQQQQLLPTPSSSSSSNKAKTFPLRPLSTSQPKTHRTPSLKPNKYDFDIDSLSVKAFYRAQKDAENPFLARRRKHGADEESSGKVRTESRSSSSSSSGKGMKRKAEGEGGEYGCAVTNEREQRRETKTEAEVWAGLRHYPSGHAGGHDAFPMRVKSAASENGAPPPVSEEVKRSIEEGSRQHVLPRIADRIAVGVTSGNLETVDSNLTPQLRAWLRKQMQRRGEREEAASVRYAVEKQFSKEGVVVGKTVLRERVFNDCTGALRFDVLDEWVFWVWEGLKRKGGADQGAEAWLKGVGQP